MDTPVKKLLILALAFGLTGCAAKAGKFGPNPLVTQTAVDQGYVHHGDSVTFVFAKPASMKAVTATSAGKMVDLSKLNIEKMSVAGEFNEWNPTATFMVKEGPVWTTTIEASKMPAKVGHFKFIANGEYWLEPNERAPNTVDNGNDTHVKNYVYTP